MLRFAPLFAALFAVLLAACQGDLPQATEVARMRVLGAQFAVDGDETRATPVPSETVHVTIPTVFPTLEEEAGAEVEALIIGCTAPTRFTGGIPICQEFIDAALSGEDPTAQLPMIDETMVRCADLRLKQIRMGALSLRCVTGTPEFNVVVPGDFTAEQMLFRGVVCEHGSPYVDIEDPRLFGCDAEGAEAIRVHGTIPVQQASDEENHNPELAGLTLVREGVEWLEYDPADLPPEEGCETAVEDDDPAVHSIVPGDHRIRVRYDAAAREELAGEPEDLEITIYTTAGEMERRFTLFEGADEADGVLSSELDWSPPKPSALPPGGQLVRFFVTLRDQRGGFAMTSRAVCLR